MTLWTIEPRDTLVCRDGKPMDESSAMTSLPLPYPSSIAGFFRTRAGSDATGAWSEKLTSEEARRIPVHGPWLALLRPDGAIDDLLVPAPRDLVWFKKVDGGLHRARMAPQSKGDGESTNLDSAVTHLLGIESRGDAPKGKAESGSTFWPWKRFEDWLKTPKSGDAVDDGLFGLVREVRTNVALEGETQTAKDGALFSVEHLRFVANLGANKRARVALVADAPDTGSLQGLNGGVFPFGGERRLMHLARASHTMPRPPGLVLDEVANSGKVRVLLLTPAHFEQGWRPSWLLEPREGVKPKLIAAAVDRPQTVSGWDLALGKPKPTRRLVSAGCVYFLELEGTPAARRAWVEKAWWSPVSDDEASRTEGFGVAVCGVGAWS